MFGLQLKTFDRDAVGDSPEARALITCYLWMRLAMGLIGISLPVLLVLVDWWFVHSPGAVRGSMSAYYHSSARDIFVGGLIATGIFLLTYMSARRRTFDFVLSTVAGVLVIAVALLPTARSGSELGVAGFTPSATSCSAYAGPPACNGFESRWGESVVRNLHVAAASAFVVTLALLCVVFALREFGYGKSAKELGPDRGVANVYQAVRQRNVPVLGYLLSGIKSPDGKLLVGPPLRVVSYLTWAVAIAVSGIWAKLGVAIPLPFAGKVGNTYLGEFGAFVSFGLAWITAAWDMVPGRVRSALGGVGEGVAKIAKVPGATPPPAIP